jgi:hypothetical protein
VTKRSKYPTQYDFEAALAKNEGLIATDQQLFRALRASYMREMCGFWRRYFSLKTLKRLRLLSVSAFRLSGLPFEHYLILLQYTESTRPTPVPLDDFTMAEVLYAYNHPSSFGGDPHTDTDWIDWVFRLRQPDKRHALEFVEGWNGTRIAIVGTVPCVASTLIGVIWTARGGDAQTAFTVASFILTLCTGEYIFLNVMLSEIRTNQCVVLLALLAVISGIDSKAN